MNIQFDHVTICSQDVERTVVFYREVLGLIPDRYEAWQQEEVPFPSLILNEKSLIHVFPPEMWGADTGKTGRDAETDSSPQDSVEQMVSGRQEDLGERSMRAAYGAGSVHHLCLAFNYKEWEALQERISAHAVPIYNGPKMLRGGQGVGVSMYILDPDGLMIELKCYDESCSGS